MCTNIKPAEYFDQGAHTISACELVMKWPSQKDQAILFI